MPNHSSDLSHLAIAEQDPSQTVALLPVGSIEQHGYLPTGIDNQLAEGYAGRFSDFLTERKISNLVFPTLNYGHTPICQGYTGSISLSKKTFQLVVKEIMLELLNQGFQKIVVVNGHRDNQSAIDEVVAALAAEQPRATLLNPVYAWLRPTNEFTRKYPDRQIPQPVKEMDQFVKKVGLLRHADAAEMSLFFALFPEQRAAFEQLLPAEPLPDLHDQLPSTHDDWVKVTAKTKGMAGDPRGVDSDAAERVIKAMCEELGRQI